MRKITSLLCGCLMVVTTATVFAQNAGKPKFFLDDPLPTLPAPLPATTVKNRKINDQFDYFFNAFGKPGEHWEKGQSPIPARNVNTLGEVPNDDWYTNRHYFKPMSIDELVKGPDVVGPPSKKGPWKVVAAKTEGVTPGFTIVDAEGRRYIVKFDPIKYPEIATAPDVIGTKFFHALGYNVPENYIVSLTREDLEVGEDTLVSDERGRKRKMTNQDIGEILMRAPRNADGTYRASASLFLSGKPVGPRRFHGTRVDDPNDIVPHEHRRDLRGLLVFCAWLGHDDSRSINSLDMLVAENGIPRVKHFLIDFGSILGSASTGPNSPRSGNVPFFSWKEASREFFSFGFYLPGWTRAKFPNYPGAGRFESEKFNAATWTPEYYNPAFANMLPEDAFWAARQVVTFTDEQIAAMVKTGQFSDPRTTAWITECLIKRRDKIGKAFLNQVLPLDFFTVQNGKLAFTDVSAKHGYGDNGPFTITWSEFDNQTGTATPLGTSGETVPSSRTGFLAADIVGKDQKRKVTVYLRQADGTPTVVGLERR